MALISVRGLVFYIVLIYHLGEWGGGQCQMFPFGLSTVIALTLQAWEPVRWF